MKNIKILIISFLITICSQLEAQSVKYEATMSEKTGTLNVHYFDNMPIAYNDNGVLKGIEIDILEQFKNWLTEKKGVHIDFKFTPYSEFDELIKSVKEGDGNTMGSGTITITEKRKAEVDFSAPYMKNASILITAGTVETARTEKEMRALLSNMQAITVKGSIHEDHLRTLYSEYKVAPRISYIKDPAEVFEKIKDSPRSFGYVDVITFWKYLRENDYYVKMHSLATYRDENFGFIFPKNSGWSNEFNEFFESGFGFTSTKEYRKILEKHLSYEVLNAVELNP